MVCFKGESSCQTYSVTEKHTRALEQLELVYAAIERLERSFVTQGNWDANCASHAGDQSCEYSFIIIDEVIALNGPI
jgi:hypothetical protein